MNPFDNFMSAAYVVGSLLILTWIILGFIKYHKDNKLKGGKHETNKK